MVSKRLGAHFGTVLDLAALISAVAVLVLVLLLQKLSWLQSVWFTSYKFMFCVPLDTKFVTSGEGGFFLPGRIWIVYTAAAGPDSDAYTTLGCSFDAAAVQMVVMVHAVGLAVMSVDRIVAVRGFAAEPRGLSLRRAAILVAVAWLSSIALGLPLVVPGGVEVEGLTCPCDVRRRGGRRTELFLVVPDGVEVEGLSGRYLCTVDSEAAAGYVWKRTRQS